MNHKEGKKLSAFSRQLSVKKYLDYITEKRIYRLIADG